MQLTTKDLVFLDGAMGTMLQQAGLRPGEVPEMLALTNPDLLTSIHRQYIDAGSRIIYTNTFGANRRKLDPCGATVQEIVPAAVQAARKAAEGTAASVALDIGPLGALMEPLGEMSFEEAYACFAEIARAGAEAGADLAVIETMSDLAETRAALLAVKENTDLPCLVTMSFEATGRTFVGCTLAAMAHTLEGLGADAIGLNCSLGPHQAAPMIRELCAHTSLPVIAKPNAGLPDPVTGGYDLGPEAFAQAVMECVAAGASMIGGCCGTTPDYIRALHQAAQGAVPGKRERIGDSFVCTATRAVQLNGVRVIGERINPTGKKRFQQALKENDLDYIVEVAMSQADAGADILDVNVGYPGVNEVELLPRVVRALQAAVDLPLQLDSTNAQALEAGLRVYSGKAAVNSVNGDPAVLAAILPVVKKYGAAVVGLTMDESGLPRTAQQRVDIARRILDAAEKEGIPARDVWIDCLTLTVSAQQDQAKHTLTAIRRIREELGLQTVLGVSNISFGLPNRLLMTQTFLTAALSAGLTLPIVNPNQTEIMDAVAAWRALSGEDALCRDYVARFAQTAAAPAAPSAKAEATLQEAVRRGMKGDAARLAQAMLADTPELTLVEEHLIPALDQVGADYERGVVFLPQLLSAAQAAQAVFEVIRASMQEKGGAPVKKGRLVIATVKGDVHDIGKNIVKTVLENYGYEVIDLGRDVPPEEIVRTVQAEGIRLVGLSALMTTTLPAMEETIRQLKRLEHPPMVMVGGAVLTEDYALQMDADFYARDARAAAEIVRKALGNEK